VFGSLCLEATSRFRCCKSKTKLIGTIPGRYRPEQRQLRYFAAVARERISPARRRCWISPSRHWAGRSPS